MLPVHVISLARETKRREDFRRRNSHVEAVFFDAVDGSGVDRDGEDASRLFAREVLADYTDAALGCAMSHHALWRRAAAGTDPFTIAEDDAVFRDDFAQQARGVLAGLEAGWDVMLWGWNFDSVLHVSPLGGVSPVVMLFSQDALRKGIEQFQQHVPPVQPMRVERAFGLLAYTVSPQGAAKLIDECFPLRRGSIYVPALNFRMRNVGLDVATNVAYPKLQSYACFPPLAVSPNVRGAR